MTQYLPDAANLLATVRTFLDETAPQLAGEVRFKMKVASYLIGICEREQVLGDVHDAADRAVWAALLARQTGDRSELAHELCAAIRRGDLDTTFDAAVEAVLARTTDDVRVVRPSYLAGET